MRKKTKHRTNRIPESKAQSFFIESMDPLGQGVAKDSEQVTFIAKTLPNETVMARVLKKKKGVGFAQLQSIEARASNRTDPDCEHFANCPGCHYLHTDYASELTYKKQALARIMVKLDVAEQDIQLVPAPQRLAYRNRIQLHYNGPAIGLVDGLSGDIVEIPRCQIIRDELRPALSALYENKSWCHNNQEHGHCELYLKDGNVNSEWNLPYAHGGFTQVFDAMNIELCKTVNDCLTKRPVSSLLDLFSGDGNLSQQYSKSDNVTRIMVDQSPHAEKHFYQIDLFSDNALDLFRQSCSITHYDAIIVDPPRKGFATLFHWVKQFKPKLLIYVSCNPATMVRDIMKLNTAVSIDEVFLLDLFPSTYHFETVCVMSIGT